ncbi:MAG TPA: peptide ABC transporter substrate-binding protein [Candidatus Eremiobacteraceae bacterium]
MIRKAAFAALAVALALAGCTHVTESSAPAQHVGSVPGVVRISRPNSPNSLNPLIGGLYIENYVQEAIFDGLVKLDGNEDLVPDLAVAIPTRANGGLSADGKTITYRLRHGVTWHDGAPFTSADVVFTYKEMTDPKVPFPSASTYAQVQSVTAPDLYTVVVRLKNPSAQALGQLFCNGEDGQIVPQHLLSHVTDMLTDPFGYNPVGTGPLKFVSWDRGNKIVLAPNPNYFGGTLHIKEVDIITVPDANTMLTMARAHELDVAQLTTPSQVTTLQGVAGIRVIEAPAFTLYHIEFNLLRAPYDDISVRTALALALDRHAIAMKAFDGYAIPADSVIPPFSWGYDPNNGAPRYDPAAAGKLLDADGWVRGPDGVRVKNGARLDPAVMVATESAAGLSGAQQVQAYWRALGVDATVKPQPLNVLLGPGGPAETGNFDVYYASNGFDVDPSRDMILSKLSIPPNGHNYSRYNNPTAERLIEEGASTYDRAARIHYYSLLQRLVNHDLPVIPIAWPKFIYAVSTDVHGFAPETVNSDFWNVEQWRN